MATVDYSPKAWFDQDDLVDIRITFDYSYEYDPLPPVPVGTEVSAYLPSDTEYLVEPGEAWYIRPDTGDQWMSLPGDFEVIK